MKRITLIGRVHENVQILKKECKKRKMKESLISHILCEILNQYSIQDLEVLLEKHTPKEYKLKQALRDPEQAKKIMDLLNQIQSPSSFKTHNLSAV